MQGGAGAVLGAARALGGLAPPGVCCHFVVASCENMIGSRGLRPGDILTASNGKTIEVNNTDAEGRLTLADALQYVQKAGATRVVDIATLTGACMVALGTNIGGMWSPQDALAASLAAASEAGGEKLWRMPLDDAYWCARARRVCALPTQLRAAHARARCMLQGANVVADRGHEEHGDGQGRRHHGGALPARVH